MAIKLIKGQAKGILGRREWWTVGNHTAVVAYGDERCGICVLDESRRDFTREVVEKLRTIGNEPKLLQTIDSCLIECPLDQVSNFLIDIEAVLGSPQI
ncbi:hypothetical protein OIK44_22290 [Janthinobacterium sp. hw3]|uniref:Ferredoxin n=2 Tax=Janthinobacterium fluminis TaxID=2987524 RepID=A0ABT5K5Q9_9BURK|nr:hypothetical protein [Janthinobacterium fluminis]